MEIHSLYTSPSQTLRAEAKIAPIARVCARLCQHMGASHEPRERNLYGKRCSLVCCCAAPALRAGHSTWARCFLTTNSSMASPRQMGEAVMQCGACGRCVGRQRLFIWLRFDPPDPHDTIRPPDRPTRAPDFPTDPIA